MQGPPKPVFTVVVTQNYPTKLPVKPGNHPNKRKQSNYPMQNSYPQTAILNRETTKSGEYQNETRPKPLQMNILRLNCLD
jgi:hypothetical protein